MTEQASFPKLKPISINQELNRQLELIRESKAKPNFGLQNAGNPDALLSHGVKPT
jgi:hypothetical protein